MGETSLLARTRLAERRFDVLKERWRRIRGRPLSGAEANQLAALRAIAGETQVDVVAFAARDLYRFLLGDQASISSQLHLDSRGRVAALSDWSHLTRRA